MEDSAIITCLKNFNSVWERVTCIDDAHKAGREPRSSCGQRERMCGYGDAESEHVSLGRPGGLPGSAGAKGEACIQRLCSCRSDPLSGEVAVLRGFMDAERGREAGYRAMYSSAGGRCGAQLRALASGCAAMIREMQIEHFLITGDTWAPTGSNVAEGRGLLRLRALYIDELLAGNGYAQQAAASEIEELKLLYGRFSELCADRASAIRALIAETIK